MPVDMFPVLFAIPRTSGWIAQWLEMIERQGAEDRPPAPDLHGRAHARLRARSATLGERGHVPPKRSRTNGHYGAVPHARTSCASARLVEQFHAVTLHRRLGAGSRRCASLAALEVLLVFAARGVGCRSGSILARAGWTRTTRARPRGQRRTPDARRTSRRRAPDGGRRRLCHLGSGRAHPDLRDADGDGRCLPGRDASRSPTASSRSRAMPRRRSAGSRSTTR